MPQVGENEHFREHATPEQRDAAERFGVAGLAQANGIDISRCEFCHEPLTRPYRRGLDGAAAHEDCLFAYVEGE